MGHDSDVIHICTQKNGVCCKKMGELRDCFTGITILSTLISILGQQCMGVDPLKKKGGTFKIVHALFHVSRDIMEVDRCVFIGRAWWWVRYA